MEREKGAPSTSLPRAPECFETALLPNKSDWGLRNGCGFVGPNQFENKLVLTAISFLRTSELGIEKDHVYKGPLQWGSQCVADSLISKNPRST